MDITPSQLVAALAPAEIDFACHASRAELIYETGLVLDRLTAAGRSLTGDDPDTAALRTYGLTLLTLINDEVRALMLRVALSDRHHGIDWTAPFAPPLLATPAA